MNKINKLFLELQQEAVYDNIKASHSFPSSEAQRISNIIDDIKNGVHTEYRERDIDLIWDSYLEYLQYGYCKHGDDSDIDDDDMKICNS